jgi:hypothetical protein
LPDHGAASGIIHILVSGEATENGLTQQTDKRMAAVLTGARIGVKQTCGQSGGVSNFMQISLSDCGESGLFMLW